MQQPNPPGGPYGNAPYAPPRRGPSPLLFCLGCLGIIGLVVIASFIYLGFRVKSMMKPITAAEVRTVLPADVPLYPRFTLEERSSRSVQVPGMSGATMTVLSFHCPDSIQTVGPWYQKQLTPRGWTGGLSPSNSRQYEFRKGNEMLAVSGSPVGDTIQLMVAHGFPEGKHPGTTFPSASGQRTW